MTRFLLIASLLIIDAGCGRDPAPGGQPPNEGWPNQAPCAPPELGPKTPKDPVQTLGLTASITVVDEGLEGESTDVTVVLADDGTVHAAYWRCTVIQVWACEPPNPEPKCSGLHTASIAPGAVRRELVKKDSGAGLSLLLDAGGLAGIAAASTPHSGTISVHKPDGAGWLSDVMGSPSQPVFGRTWSSSVNSQHRVAWTDSLLDPTTKGPKLKVVRKVGSTWTLESELDLPEETMTHTAAFDRDGKVHLARVVGDPSTPLILPTEPPALEYRAPGGEPVPVPVTDGIGVHHGVVPGRLVIDAAGDPHLLVAVYDWASQDGAPRVFLVERAGGRWTSTEITRLLPFPVVAQTFALAVDGQGYAYVALTGLIHPGKKIAADEQALLVGTNAHGSWVFHDLGDQDVDGWVDIAPAGGGRFHLGYFGRSSFKMAEVTIYR
jgi:hypothetical protein